MSLTSKNGNIRSPKRISSPSTSRLCRGKNVSLNRWRNTTHLPQMGSMDMFPTSSRWSSRLKQAQQMKSFHHVIPPVTTMSLSYRIKQKMKDLFLEMLEWTGNLQWIMKRVLIRTTTHHVGIPLISTGESTPGKSWDATCHLPRKE